MRLAGRSVSAGRGGGPALVSAKPMSFLGGVDPATGIVRDPASDIRGECVAGRVLVFPSGKGSTVGSYVLYGLARHGVAPAAIVNERTETIVATGCILGGIPLVDRIDPTAILTGDRVAVDGDAGAVELPDVIERRAATAFLRNRGRILILKRGDTAPTFPGLWSAVSGSVEPTERPLARARDEILEETAIRGARLVARGGPVFVRHDATVFVVFPFLFDAPTRRVRLDRENTDARWVRPAELPEYHTVPRLSDALAAVLPQGA